MKSKYIYILIISLAAIIFPACETIIEFDGDETIPLLVVNSFCTPDSVITVNVSKSKFFLEENYSFEFVNNADVYLWINGEQKEKLSHAGNGNYISTYKPTTGDLIKITAKSAEFSEVEGLVEIPQTVNILSIDTTSKKLDSTPIYNYIFDEYGGYKEDTIGITHNIQLNFDVKFEDPPGQNFYRLVVKQRKFFEDGSYTDSPFYFDSDDIVFGTVDEGSILNERNYSYYFEFSDELFDTKNYKLKFYCNFWLHEYFEIDNQPKIDKPGGETAENTILLIDLQSISKSYYMYIKTLVANSSVSEFFSEPVQIHSNITGGIGVIGGYTHSVYNIEIPFLQDFYLR